MASPPPASVGSGGAYRYRTGGLVAIGRCPASEHKAARIVQKCTTAPVRDTIEKVAAQYLHARARTRASTAKETKRLIEVSKADVRKLVEGVAIMAALDPGRACK